MSDPLPFPQAIVTRHKEPTLAEIKEEIFILRDFVGSLYLQLKDFQASGQLPDEAMRKIEEQDGYDLQLMARCNALAEKLEKLETRVDFQVNRLTTHEKERHTS